MLKRTLAVLTSRTFAFALLAVLQIGLLLFLALRFAQAGIAAYIIITIITVLAVVAVLEKDNMNPAYKLSWVIVMMVMPVFGTVFYLLWGHNAIPKRQRRALEEAEQRCANVLTQDPTVSEALAKNDKRLHQCAYYLEHNALAPVYPAQHTEYYPLGKDFYPRFLEELRKARRFIFLQYYIWEEGRMLDELVEILSERAANGVDVRILHDGFGSLFTLPPGFDKKMAECGIQCKAFSPLRLTAHVSEYGMLNHRDHRKLTVIDGQVGFSGGLNIADEYINIKLRFGEWKDTSFLITGEAVHSLTTTFLRSWDFVCLETSDMEAFRGVYEPVPPQEMTMERGFVQPYWDSPLDNENVSENAYLNILRHATDYVYISTPYLILDHEMVTSLALAAKSGVDVRILTPGIPDKPRVWMVTRSYYPALLKEGVRIYEYTPGFNHAKMYVSDDKVAIIGSANMDYRSLFLHFENCVSFYGGGIVDEAKQDMVESLARAHEVTLEETQRRPWYYRALQIILKFFAPLM